MKTAITKTKIETINQLHNDIMQSLKISLDKAVEIGSLLAEVKNELPHGEFGQWIKDNLTFTDRTARRYMQVFEKKELITEASNITEAYALLMEPKTDTVSDFINIPIRQLEKQKHEERRAENSEKTRKDRINGLKHEVGECKYWNVAGFKCRTQIVGYLQCLPGPYYPVIEHECVDPKYIELLETKSNPDRLKEIEEQIRAKGFKLGWNTWGAEYEF